jgi:hypothetical protein
LDRNVGGGPRASMGLVLLVMIPWALMGTPGLATAQTGGPLFQTGSPLFGQESAFGKEPGPNTLPPEGSARDVGDPGRGWFPTSAPFRSPMAAPFGEARFAAGLLSSNLLNGGDVPMERPPFRLSPRPGGGGEREVQGLVSLGAARPVWGTRIGEEVRLTVGVEGGVSARFRLEFPENDLLGSDWIAALPIGLSSGPLSGRMRVIHWSAHLGDDTIEETGARSIFFSRDGVDLLVAMEPFPFLRIYGGGESMLRSMVESRSEEEDEPIRDRFGVQGGIESGWRPFREGGGGFQAALDWRSADRIGWKSVVSVVAGIGARRGGQELRFLLRHVRGPSSMGQFFLSREELWGVELGVRW